MVKKSIIERKGARKANEIPKEVLSLLNNGTIATVNLTEWLAIDQCKLIKSTFKRMGLGKSLSSIVKLIEEQKKPSTMSSIKLIGRHLFEDCQKSGTTDTCIDVLSNEDSDTLRCYACYLIALNPDLDIHKKLEQSKYLIADPHFGVREIIWMALRPELSKNLKKSIMILKNWTKDPDENIRRFTTEAIRPRGVWCKHIDSLKENPQQAMPILEALRSDKSKYVQDSVANWLNDASKSKPEFVIELCKQWKLESQTVETEKIIKRALRTIKKLGNDISP